MRIKKIGICWFRGASEYIELGLNLKSIVLYGENGAGKSSFVDAIEYNISDGKIKHLTHEYSGRKQEKGIINTHTPTGTNSQIKITLEDNSVIEANILKNGSNTTTPFPSLISMWDYRCTILRQNELADFIADTKGNKYSALLPLLGLSHLEITAENLRRLEKTIVIQGKYDEKKADIERARAEMKTVFGAINQEGIEAITKAIYSKYCEKEVTTQTITDLLDEAIPIISTKVSQLSDQDKIYGYFLEMSELTVDQQIKNITQSAEKLAESAQPLIKEKLTVLKAAQEFAKNNKESEFPCPACGKTISSENFGEHLESEQVILQDAVEKFNGYKLDIDALCSSIVSLKRLVAQNLLKDWKLEQPAEVIEFIEKLNVNNLREVYTIENQKEISEKILPLIEIAKIKVATPVAKIADLLDSKKKLETTRLLLDISKIRKEIKKIDEIKNFISSLQKTYREQIRIQSSAIISSISTDVTRMWEILHPNEKIEDINLSIPADADKAIEIGLKFYGVSQDSPRLTLSEGHRNSLGLCIFLAMAKKGGNNPIILDDVVVSFDRNHRGMIGELLEKEFSDRQVLVLTHERDWYIDLKRQLDSKTWDFKTLMPYQSPDIGIRFSLKQFGFDDARAYLNTSPDAAGNTARKIVDTTIGVLAESLKISLPYLHRERNDTRTGHEFLEKIISLNTSFRIKNGDSYVTYTDAYEDFKKADKLLITWGNRSSHEFNIVKAEASLLIDYCENAMERFTCTNCNKEVTRLDDSRSSIKQCQCGNLRWKY
jgi:recombinational DNA repair ATPase RecF/predicted RNA-binding Zn-ribbon protein involved in translation (DUF1610 family)